MRESGTFRTRPFGGLYARNEVYAGVRGWESFEPWMTRVEEMEPARIYEAAGQVPPEWYDNEWEAMEKLVEQLIKRRGRVRELVEEFRKSSRQPFPGWGVN